MTLSRIAVRSQTKLGLLATLGGIGAILAGGCGQRRAVYYNQAPPVVVIHHYNNGYGGQGYGYGGPTVVHVHHYGGGFGGGQTVIVHHYHR